MARQKLCFSWLCLALLTDSGFPMNHKMLSFYFCLRADSYDSLPMEWTAYCARLPTFFFFFTLRCMWLHLKERGISTLPVPLNAWQPKLLLLKSGLWTQSATCLSSWHATYYLSPCAVGAEVWLVKQADGVAALITGQQRILTRPSSPGLTT